MADDRDRTDPRAARPARWDVLGQQHPMSWKRLPFPLLFLVVLITTVAGVGQHSGGYLALVGYLTVAAFCVLYTVSLMLIAGRPGPFLVCYLALYVLFALGLWTAHEDALPMAIFLGVLAIARFGQRFVPIALALVAADFLLPAIFGWPQEGQAIGLAIALAANFAFFSLLWTNTELNLARAEIAGFAARDERNRIARDLHDLLGHSLTAITVKAGLARRLGDAGNLDGCRSEVAEIEDLSRAALVDVRAAVTGYRPVDLAGELATGRELANAVGLDMVVLTASETATRTNDELFGWVVREAVTNVVRHANAQRTTVSVGPTWIEVADDGAGCHPPLDRSANGLRGLRERVTEAGGTLVSGPAEGGGWRVRVDVPDAMIVRSTGR